MKLVLSGEDACEPASPTKLRLGEYNRLLLEKEQQ